MAESETADGSGVAARRRVMGICADATGAELRAVVAGLGQPGAVRDLRRPETGLVMLRGRAGGDGRPFNLGEATVTRAAVAVEGAPNGFAYHLGRDVAKAKDAAVIDALWQVPVLRTAVEERLRPLEGRIARDRETAARRTAATRVDFFTLVRGED